MSEKIQVGQIGFGQHGGEFLEPAMRNSDIAKVVAIVDTNPDARTRAQDRGLAAYETPDEMLAQHEIQYVAVAVNHDQSVSALNALANASARKNMPLAITTEKPIATNLQQAMEAIGILKDAFKFAAVFNRFLYPPFSAGLEIVAGGALGQITNIHDEIIISGPPPLLDPYIKLPDPKHPENTRGNAIQNGFHSASIAALLGGIPETVSAQIGRIGFYPKTEVDDTALVAVQYPNKQISYHLQWGETPAIVVNTRINGTLGGLLIEQWGDIYTSIAEQIKTQTQFPKRGDFAGMHASGNRLFHEAIIRYLQGEKDMPHVVKNALSLGIISQFIVEAAYISSKQGGIPITPKEAIGDTMNFDQLRKFSAQALLSGLS